MATNELVQPYPVFTDRDGLPLDDGYIYIGEPNKNPETNPVTVYFDSYTTIPAAQPLRTINGYIWRNGAPARIYTAGGFSITVRNKSKELVITSPVGFGIIPGVSLPSGYQPPVVYESGLSVIDPSFTVEYNNGIYAPNPSELPFTTTDPFDPEQWILINSNTVFKNVDALRNDTTVSYPTGTVLQTKEENYSYSVADPSATDAPVTNLGGVKLYPLETEDGFFTPQMFGLKGEPGDATDNGAALQDYFDYMASIGATKFTIDGDFSTSIGLVVECNDVVEVIDGSFVLRALGPITDLIEYRNLNHGLAPIKHRLWGDGNTAVWSSWTCRNGIVFYNCRRSRFGKIQADKFYQWGVKTSDDPASNNNGLSIDAVHAIDCGTWYSPAIPTDLRGIAAFNWSNPVNSGSFGSTSQRTVLDVDVQSNGVEVGGLLNIGGEPYFITALPSATTVEIFPFLSSTAGASGTGDYIIGGSLKLAGGDGGEVSVDLLDATRCGEVYSAQALYGSTINRIISQFCYVAYRVGYALDGAHLGDTISQFYTEGNFFDIINTTTAGEKNITISSTVALDFEKVLSLSPRNADGSFSPFFSHLNGFVIRDGNGFNQYLQLPGNLFNNIIELDKNIGLVEGVQAQGSPSSYEISLGEVKNNFNRLFGTSVKRVEFFRWSAGIGQITFNMSAADVADGWTINGSSNPFSFTPPAGNRSASVTFGVDFSINTIVVQAYF